MECHGKLAWNWNRLGKCCTETVERAEIATAEEGGRRRI